MHWVNVFKPYFSKYHWAILMSLEYVYNSFVHTCTCLFCYSVYVMLFSKWLSIYCIYYIFQGTVFKILNWKTILKKNIVKHLINQPTKSVMVSFLLLDGGIHKKYQTIWISLKRLITWYINTWKKVFLLWWKVRLIGIIWFVWIYKKVVLFIHYTNCDKQFNYCTL